MGWEWGTRQMFQLWKVEELDVSLWESWGRQPHQRQIKVSSFYWFKNKILAQDSRGIYGRFLKPKQKKIYWKRHRSPGPETHLSLIKVFNHKMETKKLSYSLSLFISSHGHLFLCTHASLSSPCPSLALHYSPICVVENHHISPDSTPAKSRVNVYCQRTWGTLCIQHPQAQKRAGICRVGRMCAGWGLVYNNHSRVRVLCIQMSTFSWMPCFVSTYANASLVGQAE